MKRIFYLASATILFSTIIFSQQFKSHNSKVILRDAWIRPAAAGANTALFFEVVNNGETADTLLSAESKLAEVVELHETYKKENDMMGMREVHKVAIPAKSSKMFKPRDLHIMLIGTLKDIRLGEKHEVALVFKNAGTIKVTAVVRDMPKMK